MKTILLGCLLLFNSPLIADEASTDVTVTLQTPHPGFSVKIEPIVLKDDTFHVLARVTSPPADGDMVFAMVITSVR